MNFLKLVRAFFDKGKRVLLFVFFFICLGIYYWPLRQYDLALLVPFIFGATFIIIELLCRLSATIEKESTSSNYIIDRHEAFKLVEEEIQFRYSKRRHTDHPLSVKIIGLRGRYIITQWLDTFLKQNKKVDSWLRNIRFDCYILDKVSAQRLEGMENYLKDIDATHARLDILSNMVANDPE